MIGRQVSLSRRLSWDGRDARNVVDQSGWPGMCFSSNRKIIEITELPPKRSMPWAACHGTPPTSRPPSAPEELDRGRQQQVPRSKLDRRDGPCPATRGRGPSGAGGGVGGEQPASTRLGLACKPQAEQNPLSTRKRAPANVRGQSAWGILVRLCVSGVDLGRASISATHPCRHPRS